MSGHILFAGQDEPGLYLVHPNNEADNCTCEVFILHGLNGGPTKTWRHPDTGSIWFRDLLPDQLRNHTPRINARIWSYGYNASTSFNTQSVYGHANTLLNFVKTVRRGHERRKIIWICHSLGGIVVKSALIEAGLQPQYAPIQKATAGIIFLGTPHRGSDVATLGQMAALIAGAVAPPWQVFNRALIKSLERDNEGLFQTCNRFSHICETMKIHSFFETRPLGPRVIVPDTSAILSLPSECVTHGLNGNHKEISRFRDSNDQNWRPVLASILELVALTAVPTAAPRNASRPPPPHPGQGFSEVPHRPMPRQDPQQQSAQYLQPSAPSPEPPNSGDRQASQQRSRADEPPASSARRPYPSVNPAYSREDLSMNHLLGADRTGIHLAPPTSIPSQAPPRELPVRPSSASPQPQTRGSRPGTGDFDTSNADESSRAEAALCDGCGNSIRCSQRRVCCTECYDYDLCITCFQAGRITKAHKRNHRVSHIVGTQILSQEDLLPPHDLVNPDRNPQGTKENWSIRQIPDDAGTGSKEWRMIHLHNYGSHARFLTGARPGHFAILLCFVLEAHTSLNQTDRESLEKEGFGWLRISFGTLRNKKDFFNGRYQEDSFDSLVLTESSLPHRLLSDYWYDVVRIPISQQIIQVQSDTVLSVAGQQGSQVDLGLILQWSGTAGFTDLNEPVMKMSVNTIRLDDVVDYNEPLVRVRAPDAPVQAPAQSPAPAPDVKEELSVDDWIQALAQIEREVQDAQERARLEAQLKQLFRQQERERAEALMRALYAKAVREAQEREEREQVLWLLRFLST